MEGGKIVLDFIGGGDRAFYREGDDVPCAKVLKGVKMVKVVFSGNLAGGVKMTEKELVEIIEDLRAAVRDLQERVTALEGVMAVVQEAVDEVEKKASR